MSNRLDAIISNIDYIYWCLRNYRDMQESGSCNDCARKTACEYAPDWGQRVRYNCPFYQREEEESKT